MAITLSTFASSGGSGATGADVTVNVTDIGQMVLALSYSGGATASLTVNSTSVTRVSTVANSSVFMETGWLFPAATGALVVGSTGAAQRRVLIASVWNGVDSTTPIGTTVTSTGASSTPAVTVASSNGDVVVSNFAVAGSYTNKTSLSTVSGEVVVDILSSGYAISSVVVAGMFYAPGGGNVVMNALAAGTPTTSLWVAHGFCLNAAVGMLPGNFVSWWY
jgi:hypothetical protein